MLIDFDMLAELLYIAIFCLTCFVPALFGLYVPISDEARLLKAEHRAGRQVPVETELT